jgi:hypothetical protein
MPEDRCFVVTFRDPTEGGVTTLRAREVGDSELGLGFVAISGLLFDSGRVIVDPKQDVLRARYANVRRLHVNLYTILTIEEVGAENAGLSLDRDRSNLVVLRPPGGDGSDA